MNATGEEVLRRTKRLGVTTNNVAEYEGVILALELASALGAARVHVRLDSELVVNQLNGTYKVKHPPLQELHDRVHILRSKFRSVEIVHVPREEMDAADKLANDALDGKA
jgi:ribonuclease HI